MDLQTQPSSKPLSVAPADVQPPKRRDAYIDNAKFILIALVIIGHLLEQITYSAFADGVYTWIYMFHMPAFVVISGYLSRSFTGTTRNYRSLVTTLLAPYILIQAILSLEKWLFRDGDFTLNLFVPNWALWYLLALFVWRLATPLLRSIPHPLLISIAISIASVAFGGISQDLSGARILSFLPFFTLGLLTTPEHVERFKKITGQIWVRMAVGVFLVASLAVTYLLHDWIVRKWLYMYGNYGNLHLSNIENVLLRAAVLIVCTIMLLAFLAIVPRGRTFFTRFGKATLYVYILQAAIIYPIAVAIGDWKGWTAPLLIVLMVGGALLALVLSTGPVQRATKWLVDPLSR